MVSFDRRVEFTSKQEKLITADNHMMSMTYLKRTIGLVGLIMMFTLSGCQSFQPTQPSELALEDSEFMSLWDTYNQCQEEGDLDKLQQFVHQLHAAPRPISIHHSPIPLPQFLTNLATPRGSRLSVDPRAMTASCAIRAGNRARYLSDHETAQSMYELVVSNYPELEYAFYVEQAQFELNQLLTVRPVSLSASAQARF